MPRVYYPRARAILQLIFEGFGGPSSEPKVVPVLPRSCRVHRNSYTQADSFSLTFDALDLPIQPDLIQSGAVELFLYDEQVDDSPVLSRGLTDFDFGNMDETSLQTGLSIRQLKKIQGARFALGREPTIAGLFDEVRIEYSDSGCWVTIEGQDYTTLLKERLWPLVANRSRVRRVPYGMRLDVLLKQLLAEAEPDVSKRRLRLSVRGIEPSSLPVVGRKEVRHHKKGVPVSPQSSYWDVMYSLSGRYGFILYVEGLDVVLSTPHSITSDGRTRALKMIYGSNIARFNQKRKLGKERVPQIEVRSYDPDTRTTLVGVWPPVAPVRPGVVRKKKKQKHKTGTGDEREEVQVLRVNGIRDVETLRRSARLAFELIGRGEMITVMETNDLYDLSGQQSLLDLRTGDAVNIEVDPTIDSTRILSDKSVGEQEKVQYLVSRGYNYSIAQVLARHHEKLQSNRVLYRVRNVTYDYNVDGPLTIECEMSSFVKVDGVSEEA